MDNKLKLQVKCLEEECKKYIEIIKISQERIPSYNRYDFVSVFYKGLFFDYYTIEKLRGISLPANIELMVLRNMCEQLIEFIYCLRRLVNFGDWFGAGESEYSKKNQKDSEYELIKSEIKNINSKRYNKAQVYEMCNFIDGGRSKEKIGTLLYLGYSVLSEQVHNSYYNMYLDKVTNDRYSEINVNDTQIISFFNIFKLELKMESENQKNS